MLTAIPRLSLMTGEPMKAAYSPAMPRRLSSLSTEVIDWGGKRYQIPGIHL